MKKMNQSAIKAMSTKEVAFIANRMNVSATKAELTRNWKTRSAEIISLDEQFRIQIRAEKAEKEKAEKLAELMKKAEEAKNENPAGDAPKTEKPKREKKQKEEKKPEAVISAKGKTCVVLKQGGKRVAELWIDLSETRKENKRYCDIWVLTGANVASIFDGATKVSHGKFTQFQYSANRAGKLAALRKFNEIKRACRTTIVEVR